MAGLNRLLETTRSGAGIKRSEADAVTRMFESAATYLSILSESTRLRILHAICNEEKSVNAIVAETGASQTNVSRHLSLMHRSRVLNRRRDGNTVFYSVADRTLVEICRSVCLRLAIDIDEGVDERIAARAFLAAGAARKVSKR